METQMYLTSKLLKQLSGAVLALAAASSAIAAPATLSTSITGIGTAGAPELFGTLPQNVSYTFSTAYTYDSEYIGHEAGTDSTYGNMAITLVAGDQRLEFTNHFPNSTPIWVSRWRYDQADGYNNELRLNWDVEIDDKGRTFEISQTIRWKDGTAAPTDVLRTPQLLDSDDYKWDLSVKAWWDDYWLGTMRIDTGAGSLAVSMVPEPSEAGMLVAGLAIGAFAIRRRRAAERAVA
jgi:hypothetical protein